LCPNCHSKAHFSSERNQFQNHLLQKVRDIESALSRIVQIK
jgi:hypothetical protein